MSILIFSGIHYSIDDKILNLINFNRPCRAVLNLNLTKFTEDYGAYVPAVLKIIYFKNTLFFKIKSFY